MSYRGRRQRSCLPREQFTQPGKHKWTLLRILGLPLRGPRSPLPSPAHTNKMEISGFPEGGRPTPRPTTRRPGEGPPRLRRPTSHYWSKFAQWRSFRSLSPGWLPATDDSRFGKSIAADSRLFGRRVNTDSLYQPRKLFFSFLGAKEMAEWKGR